MTLPPMILRIRFKEEGSRGFSLWLPIFLLLPLIYPALLLLVAFSALVFRRGFALRPWLAVSEPFRLFHAFRGLTVDVNSGDSRVFVSID